MRVSVVITTYNGREFIQEQLDSIRMQTNIPEEVIIADDGSTDGTREYLEKYISQYHLVSWRVILREENLGWKRNFIDTMKLADGDIILLADQDDIWFYDKVDKYKNAFENDRNICVLVSDYLVFYDCVNNDQQVFERQLQQMESRGGIERWPVNYQFHITDRPGCVYGVRKSFFDEIIDCYAEEHPHDSYLWLSSILIGGLYILQEPLISYRRHASNAIKRKTISNIEINNRKEFVERELKIMQSINKKRMERNITLHESAVEQSFIKFCETRIHLFKYKKFSTWIWLLLCYRKFYASMKSLVADWIVCVKGVHE